MTSNFYSLFLEPLINSMDDHSGEIVVFPGWWEAVDKHFPGGRCFKTFFYEIKEMLPENLQKELAFKVGFWAPEVAWDYISDFINRNIPADSNNDQSIKIYAKLCNVSETKMKEMMIAKGL